MLVLSRKEDESVIIGPLKDGTLIEVLCVRVGYDRVRLGFNAPKEIPVHREEIFEFLQDNNKKPLASK